MITDVQVASPYKGLAPFEDSALDALLFFGRERESEIVAMNLLASRLTVLYGPTGVGKSSLLRAGVARRLRELAPDGEVVVIASWRDDPVATIRDAIAPDAGSASLVGAVASRGADVYLVLDQFEEYFIYHADERGPGSLVEELPELVNGDQRINVLLGIREDALAKLDVFKARLPRLFGNYLRLDHLDRDAARDAILGPLARYSELTGQEWGAQPELVDAVLEQVETGKIDIGQAGPGLVERSARPRVEAPFLQLVLHRLWELERAAGSTTLTLTSLAALGGAARIVEDHLEHALGSLTPVQQDTAAAIFEHLVTPSGSKIAHRLSDLATYAALDPHSLEPIVGTLEHQRILRALRDGTNGDGHYEIYHDVLAGAVLAWRSRHETERRLETARRRHRRALALVAVVAAGLVVMTAIAVYALAQRGQARSAESQARSAERAAEARALDASALRALDTNPEQSLQLAVREARAFPIPEAESTLRASLLASHLRKVLHVGGNVLHVSYSTDGRRILAVSSEGPVRIYDAKSGRLLRSLGAKLRAHDASFSPDARLVVTAGAGFRAVLWDARSGKIVRQLPHGARVRAAAFSEDGTLVVTAGAKLVRIWRVADGALVQTIHVPRNVRAATLREDNTLVAVVASDRFARVYHVQSGTPLYSLDHGAKVTHALFVGSSMLVTSGEDTEGVVWSMADGSPIRDLYGHEGQVLDIAAQPQGRLLATASADGTARVWTLGLNPHLYAQLTGHVNPVTGVAFSPNGFSIVTRSSDGTARVWRPTGGLARAVLAGHDGPVTDAVFSPNGKRVATGGDDGTVRVWDPQTEPPLSLLHRFGRPISQIARSSNGKVLLVGTAAGTYLVQAATGDVARKLSGPRNVTAVAFSGDERAVIVSGRRGWIVDTESGRTLRRFRDASTIAAVATAPGIVATAGSDGAVTLRRTGGSLIRRVRVAGRPLTSVRFDAAGRRFAAGSEDHTARIFRLDGHRPQVLRTTRAVTAVSFSPDGRTLVTAARDGELRTWDARTGTPLRRLSRHFSIVSDVEYSPDGRWIISAGPVTAGLWNGKLTQFVFFLRGHRPRLTSALFEPDSQRIVTAGTDGTLRTYRCDICGRLPALLELAEGRLAAAR